jgi:hypothetical protein
MIVIVLVGVILGVIRQRRRTPAGDVLTMPLDPGKLERVVALLDRGRKIQAVKELRSGTSMGLAEAKTLTEAIQSGHRPPAPVTRTEEVGADEPSASATTPQPNRPESGRSEPDLAERARTLRAEGREIMAVRMVCDETGMNILDAQKFVRAL